MQLSPHEFDLLSNFVKSNTGIELNTDKTYLLEHRFAPLLKRYGFDSYGELYESSKVDSRKRQEMVDAICTNETSFFRDLHPFSALTEAIVPNLLRIDPSRKLRILSAACSSGQEAVSICIALAESGFELENLHVLGVDISHDVLLRARQACYTPFEVKRGLMAHQIPKYMKERDGKFVPTSAITDRISFQQANLLVPGSVSGKFDIVFCRNVACYFDVHTKQRLFTNIGEVMTPDGYLVVGSTENLEFISSRFKAHNASGSIYYTLIAH